MKKIRLSENQRRNRVNWVKDLLSDLFNQANGILKESDSTGRFSYCCLGVACERVAPKSKNLVMEYSLGEDKSGSSDQAYLTPRVASLLGMASEWNDDQNMASEWNDSHDLSFRRIADFVAYSTEHRLRFTDLPRIDDSVDPDSYPGDAVPEGFAVSWLENQAH